MPPNSQLPQAGSQPGKEILKPGDRVVRDDAGNITDFGKFKIISNSAEAKQAFGAVIGVYADGGVGKTTFFCELADPKKNPELNDLPMLALDYEAGIKSVAHLVGPNLQDLPLHTVTDLEDWVDYAEAQPREKFPWKTVYLDNLSDLLAKALGEQGFHNKANAGPGLTSSQPDYNAVTTRLTIVLQRLKDLARLYGFNLFISLWEQTEKTSQGDVIGYRADINPKLATRVRGMLDYIGYMTVLKSPIVVNRREQWIRKLDFAPNPEQDSKWRVTPDHYDDIPFEIYNPCIVDILDTIKRDKPFNKAKFAKPASH